MSHIVGQVIEFRIELFDDFQACPNAHPTLSLHKLVKSFFLGINLFHVAQESLCLGKHQDQYVCERKQILISVQQAPQLVEDYLHRTNKLNELTERNQLQFGTNVIEVYVFYGQTKWLQDFFEKYWKLIDWLQTTQKLIHDIAPL